MQHNLPHQDREGIRQRRLRALSKNNQTTSGTDTDAAPSTGAGTGVSRVSSSDQRAEHGSAAADNTECRDFAAHDAGDNDDDDDDDGDEAEHSASSSTSAIPAEAERSGSAASSSAPELSEDGQGGDAGTVPLFLGWLERQSKEGGGGKGKKAGVGERGGTGS